MYPGPMTNDPDRVAPDHRIHLPGPTLVRPRRHIAAGVLSVLLALSCFAASPTWAYKAGRGADDRPSSIPVYPNVDRYLQEDTANRNKYRHVQIGSLVYLVTQLEARHTTENPLSESNLPTPVDNDAFGTVAVGRNAGATYYGATAIGVDSGAAGIAAVAIGRGSRAPGARSIALGARSRAQGGNSVALGTDSHAQSASSTALGSDSRAQGASSTAVGANAVATAANSIALSRHASAIGTDSVALGRNVVARSLRRRK